MASWAVRGSGAAIRIAFPLGRAKAGSWCWEGERRACPTDWRRTDGLSARQLSQRRPTGNTQMLIRQLSQTRPATAPSPEMAGQAAG